MMCLPIPGEGGKQVDAVRVHGRTKSPVILNERSEEKISLKSSFPNVLQSLPKL